VEDFARLQSAGEGIRLSEPIYQALVSRAKQVAGHDMLVKQDFYRFNEHASKSFGRVLVCDDSDLAQANCVNVFALHTDNDGVRIIAAKDIPHSGAPEVYVFPCEGYGH